MPHTEEYHGGCGRQSRKTQCVKMAKIEKLGAVDVKLKTAYLFDQFVILNQNVLNKGANMSEMKFVCKSSRTQGSYHRSHFRPAMLKKLGYVSTATVVFTLFLSILLRLPLLDGMMKSALGIRCFLPNNYFVWEATRPIADCNICRGVNEVLMLPNITREEFFTYAYSYKPILVKGAAKHWPAAKSFSFSFFKSLFENIDGAYESTEEDCQFLTFKTDFLSLRDVFAMPQSRVTLQEGETSWYIGWSNCYPPVLEVMRQHYSRPHFLPADAEHAHVDYIFMGYQQGAVMHLDYISRLMWQAQLQGHKTWRLNPPPECENVCQGFQFRVEPGDIFLLDTRQWYHDTFIEEGEFSLTVSSEYG